MTELLPLKFYQFTLTLLHSERPKLRRFLALPNAVGLKQVIFQLFLFVMIRIASQQI